MAATSRRHSASVNSGVLMVIFYVNRRSVEPIEVVRPPGGKEMPVRPCVRNDLGKRRTLRQSAVVTGQVRMRTLAPRVERQCIEKPRRGGAIGDCERIAGEDLVLGQLLLEHPIDHVDPAPLTSK